MTPPPVLFHALLRPAVLQILRSTGYHAARPVVLDAVTELAARYMFALCQATARHAGDNDPQGDGPGIVDMRMALQELGAVPPDDVLAEGRGAILGEILDSLDDEGRIEAGAEVAAAAAVVPNGEGDLTTATPVAVAERGRDREGIVEDTRGVDEFIKWFSGPRNKAIREAAVGDGELELGDYLNVLKKKHSKTGEDSKYHGTIIGKGNDVGEVQVEGGDLPSIHTWRSKMQGPPPGSAPSATSPRIKEESRPPSSGLSSGTNMRKRKRASSTASQASVASTSTSRTEGRESRAVRPRGGRGRGGSTMAGGRVKASSRARAAAKSKSNNKKKDREKERDNGGFTA
ncbi:bromodomain associated domain-containing protein [Colletotrichum orchidophilum]|uniref:Bromodomain associated domain-containing protein n=1 Tax=Colletotrichum orchidophilum TaxID=1209926 RepID=A0A1G4BIY2_9PEZI|nr:bromodomain associated domain-containing protein [Colletotrichum orchidophilum]OHF01266.1 bromodomain associated domain-containing protein [Colletotrichum orchidophilum]